MSRVSLINHTINFLRLQFLRALKNKHIKIFEEFTLPLFFRIFFLFFFFLQLNLSKYPFPSSSRCNLRNGTLLNCLNYFYFYLAFSLLKRFAQSHNIRNSMPLMKGREPISFFFFFLPCGSSAKYQVWLRTLWTTIFLN